MHPHPSELTLYPWSSDSPSLGFFVDIWIISAFAYHGQCCCKHWCFGVHRRIHWWTLYIKPVVQLWDRQSQTGRWLGNCRGCWALYGETRGSSFWADFKALFGSRRLAPRRRCSKQPPCTAWEWPGPSKKPRQKSRIASLVSRCCTSCKLIRLIPKWSFLGKVPRTSSQIAIVPPEAVNMSPDFFYIKSNL